MPAKLFQRRALRAVALALLAACAAAPHRLVLPYAAFGPQAMSFETLGFEWWQWQPHGDSRPRHYDVRVVVYRGLSEAQIRREYPVDAAREKDYRYIEYGKALEYVDANIAEAESDGMTELAGALRRTRRAIVEGFGD